VAAGVSLAAALRRTRVAAGARLAEVSACIIVAAGRRRGEGGISRQRYLRLLNRTLRGSCL